MKTILRIGGEAERLMQDLTISKEPSLKLARAETILDWIDGAKAQLASKVVGFVQEYGRHYRLHFGPFLQDDSVREIADQVGEATRSKWAAVALYLVELFASAMFFVMFIAGSLILRLAAGAAVAILIGVAVTYSVIRYVRREAEDQPDKMKARITRGLTIFGSIWLVAAVGVLLVPRFEAGAVGTWLFPVLTGIVTLLSPVLAAFCTAAHDVFGWSRTIVSKIDAVHVAGRKVHQLEQAALRVLHARGADLTRRIIPPVLLLFLLICRGGAAEVRVLADVSPSVDRVQLAREINMFVDLLNANPVKRATLIRIIPFYDNPWTAPDIAAVLLPPTASFDCEVAPVSELTLISKAYAAAAARGRDATCRISREQAERKATAEHTNAIANIRNAVTILERVRVTGRCTAFYDAIRRAANQAPPGIAVIFSDSVDSCHHVGAPTFGDGGKSIVFVVPVSAASPTGPASDLFEEARQKLALLASFVRVIEPYRMNEILDAVKQSVN